MGAIYWGCTLPESLPRSAVSSEWKTISQQSELLPKTDGESVTFVASLHLMTEALWLMRVQTR